MTDSLMAEKTDDTFAYDSLASDRKYMTKKEEAMTKLCYYQLVSISSSNAVADSSFRLEVLSDEREPSFVCLFSGVSSIWEEADSGGLFSQCLCLALDISYLYLLFISGEKKLGTDEETFVILLGHAGRQQLLAVFEEYKAISGITLEQAVKSEFSGDLHKAILTIIQCMQSRPRYYAKRLHKAMEGLGTDDDTLIRILVSRSEIDLGNIKKEYETLYGCTLLSAIKGETSGDYKKALCAIVGSA
ncbi:annexin B10-like [Artemia franciscana]|uniref:annexin B10-like n=1 Tax=Artemia franciscana TaxID=6661 RepID=UPI0032DAE0F0